MAGKKEAPKKTVSKKATKAMPKDEGRRIRRAPVQAPPYVIPVKRPRKG